MSVAWKDRLVRHLESGGVLHEGQAGFRAKRSCEPVQGRLRRLMHSDTVRRSGVRGKMWRVIKEMYRVSRSAVLLDGERSKAFDVILFINGQVEQACN